MASGALDAGEMPTETLQVMTRPVGETAVPVKVVAPASAFGLNDY